MLVDVHSGEEVDIAEVARRFKATFKGNDRYEGRCPGHDDQKSSLSIFKSAKGIIVKCHASCDWKDLLAKVDLEHTSGKVKKTKEGASEKKATIAATYDHHDEAGTFVFQAVRYDPKDFRLRRPKTPGVKDDQWIWNTDGVALFPYKLDELADTHTLWWVEGHKDADNLWSLGLPATTSPHGATDWNDSYADRVIAASGLTRLYVTPDHDNPGWDYVEKIANSFAARDVAVHIVRLPGIHQGPPSDQHGRDISDWLNDGHDKAELLKLADEARPWVKDGNLKAYLLPPRTLAELRAACTKWFGAEYDFNAMAAVAATAAAEQLGGDPLWLLLISGSGATKTETVSVLVGVNALIVSTISSNAAFLSGSAKKDRTTEATGGLLVEMGARGILVIKDFTTILSMNANLRAEVLAALREIHDGHWVRSMGVDGGKRLVWKGRIAIVGAVTTAWDAHHSVIASLGDRFVCKRIDSNLGRIEAGRHALANIDREVEMRHELAEIMSGVVTGMNRDAQLSVSDATYLLKTADLVTRCRTAVDTNYRGDVISGNLPEYPTRFLKQLAQLMRGAISIGMEHDDALALVLGCAADSIPPLRLGVLRYLGGHPRAELWQVWKGIEQPKTTVRRILDELHILGLVKVDERIKTKSVDDLTYGGSTLHFSLAANVDMSLLDAGFALQMGQS